MNAALIDHLWQSTLFGAAAWSLTLALRSNSAALRHWLWMAASLKFLVPFSALFALGTLLALPADTRPEASLLGTALTAASPVVAPSISLHETGYAPLSITGFALLAAWIVGAIFFAWRWYAAWRVAAFITRAARPAPGAPADARVTDADIEPAVARVFRPVVLLPAALLGSLPATQLSAVLAHEREHINRSDNLKAGIHRLVEVLFWFHPLVWWIGRQLVEERERACDEAVLADGHDGADYAAGILAVCRHCVERPRFAVSAVSGNLTQRIRCILASGRPRELGFFKAAALTACALVLTAAPLIAGALDDAARRGVLLNVNLRTLRDADLTLVVAVPGAAERAAIRADARGVSIRNASLRDLVALAYGVRPWQIEGGGNYIDVGLYDVYATARDSVSDPENLDPYALREVVTRLLGDKFGLEIHVNRQCQAPCGRYALTAPDTPR